MSNQFNDNEFSVNELANENQAYSLCKPHNVGEFIADQLGECCLCHLCGEPIVGEIVSLGYGIVTCDYCVNSSYIVDCDEYQDEFDQ